MMVVLEAGPLYRPLFTPHNEVRLLTHSIENAAYSVEALKKHVAPSYGLKYNAFAKQLKQRGWSKRERTDFGAVAKRQSVWCPPSMQTAPVEAYINDPENGNLTTATIVRGSTTNALNEVAIQKLNSDLDALAETDSAEAPEETDSTEAPADSCMEDPTEVDMADTQTIPVYPTV